jgi:hypothetical protein
MLYLKSSIDDAVRAPIGVVRLGQTIVLMLSLLSLLGCDKNDPYFQVALQAETGTYNPPIPNKSSQDIPLAFAPGLGTPVRKAVGGGVTLATFTPTAAFYGNQTAITGGAVGTQSEPSSAILVRESNCSLTHYAISYGSAGVYGSSSSIVATLPNADSYLHQLSGLTSTAGTFPKGCSNRSLGTPSINYVHLGRSNDGYLIAAYVDDSGKVTALKIGATGAVQSQSVLASSNAAHTLVAADFNGDGIADLVTPLITVNNVTGVGVYLSRADGSFGAVTVYGGYPANLNRFYVRASIEDINGDGKLDIVAMGAPNSGIDPPTLVTLLGSGNGGFTSGSAGVKTMSLASFVLADFNADGKVDVMTAAGYWMQGAGDGSFGPATQRFTNPTLVDGRTLAVGDFDGDGMLDLALRSGRAAITIFKGLGDGNFSEKASYASIRGADALTASDINGDGILDLVVGVSSPGAFGANGDAQTVIQILFGRGDGSFIAAQALPGVGKTFLGGGPTVAVADFSGDTYPDLVARSPLSNTSLSLYRGTSQGGFAAASNVATLSFPATLFVTGDLDADGKPDIVAAAGSGLAVIRGLGNSSFATPLYVALPNATGSIVNLAVGDVNGDGRSDVVLILGGQSATTGGAYLYLANADGSLKSPVQIDNSANIRSITIGDLNGDGRADVVLGNFDPKFYISPNLLQGVRVYRGNADGSVTTPLTLSPSGVTYTALGIGDMNRDGKADLLVSALDAGLNDKLYVLPGQGDGSFGTATSFALPGGGPGITSLAVGDFTFDGALDIMITGRYTEVLVGKGDGTIAFVSALAIAPEAIYAATVDLNRDGTADAVVVNADGVVPLLRVAGPLVTKIPVPSPAASNEFSTELGSSSGSVSSGASVQTNLSLSFGANFTQAVSFSCAGLPAYASCSFSPATISPGANSTATTVTISTGVVGATAMAHWPRALIAGAQDNPLGPAKTLIPTFAIFGGLGWCGLTSRRLTKKRHRLLLGGGLILALLFSGLGACGGGSSTSTASSAVVTPSGTYPVTVTATGGGVSKSMIYTLTVR